MVEEEELRDVPSADPGLEDVDVSLFGALMQLVRVLVSCVVGFKVLSKRH